MWFMIIFTVSQANTILEKPEEVGGQVAQLFFFLYLLTSCMALDQSINIYSPNKADIVSRFKIILEKNIEKKNITFLIIRQISIRVYDMSYIL